MRVVCIIGSQYHLLTVGKVYDVLTNLPLTGSTYPVYNGGCYIILNDKGNRVLIKRTYFTPLREYSLNKLIE
jgi:hypothetical protein